MPNIVIPGQPALNPFKLDTLEFSNQPGASVAPAGKAKLRFNGSVLEVSYSGGAYSALGGGISGSIAANQVAYGSGSNAIQGSANFTYNGSSLNVTGAVAPGTTPAFKFTASDGANNWTSANDFAQFLARVNGASEKVIGLRANANQSILQFYNPTTGGMLTQMVSGTNGLTVNTTLSPSSDLAVELGSTSLRWQALNTLLVRNPDTGSSLTLRGHRLNGAGNVGIILDTNASFSTTGAIPVSFQTGGSEYMRIVKTASGWSLKGPLTTALEFNSSTDSYLLGSSTNYIAANWNLADSTDIFAGGSLSTRFKSSSVEPGGDGARAFGASNARWSVGYFGQNGVGTGSSIISLSVHNNTAATAGDANRQFSPLITLSGQGWDSTASASKTVTAALQAQASSQDGNEPWAELVLFSKRASGSMEQIARFSRINTNPATPGLRIYGDNATAYMNLSSFAGSAIVYGTSSIGVQTAAANTISISTSSVERLRMGEGGVRFGDGAAVSMAAASVGVQRYNNTTKRFQHSLDNSSFNDVPNMNDVNWSPYKVCVALLDNAVLQNANETRGHKFQFHSPCTFRGVRFFWRGGGGARTIKIYIRMYRDYEILVNGETINVNTQGTYTLMFATPVTIGAGGSAFDANTRVYQDILFSMYETSGTYAMAWVPNSLRQYQYGSYPYIANTWFDYHMSGPIVMFSSIFLKGVGDTIPSTSTSVITEGFVPWEPIFTVP
jgi:hypothetical protein